MLTALKSAKQPKSESACERLYLRSAGKDESVLSCRYTPENLGDQKGYVDLVSLLLCTSPGYSDKGNQHLSVGLESDAIERSTQLPLGISLFRSFSLYES